MSCQRSLSWQDKISRGHCPVPDQAILRAIVLSLRLQTAGLMKLISLGSLAIPKSDIQQTEQYNNTINHYYNITPYFTLNPNQSQAPNIIF
jgi:hypothetical protein